MNDQGQESPRSPAQDVQVPYGIVSLYWFFCVSSGPYIPCSSLKPNLGNFSSSSLLSPVTMLMDSIKRLTTENKAVKDSVADLCRQSAPGRDKKRAKSGSVHEEMVNRFSTMQTDSSDHDGTTEVTSNADGDRENRDEVDGGSIRPSDLVEYPILTRDSYQKLCQVVDDVGLLKMSVEASAIKFGNLGIWNLQECTQWMKKFHVDAKYGLIIDPLTLLDLVCGDDAVDPITQLKTTDAMSKLSIDTVGESSALTSMKHARPRIFHTGRPMMICDQKTSRLNLLCKPVKWKSGSDGIRNSITERMNVLQPHLRDDINYAFSKNPERDAKAQMITTLSLTASVTFVTQLLNYIDTLYEKLHIYSKFTSQTAWSLSMQVLDRILADLYVPKEGANNGMKKDRASICSHILWASLKTLDIAQVDVDENFVNHPAISSEFIKFLATNSGSEKIEQVSVTITLMKTSLANCVSESQTASRKIDTASTRCGELTNTCRDINSLVTALTNRVRALESNRPARGAG